MGGYGSGRKSRPTEIKKLEGAESRRINDHEAQYERLSVAEPPSGFPPAARQIWEHYAPILIKSGVLTVADIPAFTDMCLSWDAIQEAQEHLQAEGRVIVQYDPRGNGKEIVNPWHRILRDNRSDFARSCARFGLTPADRANLVVPEENPPQGGKDPNRLLT